MVDYFEYHPETILNPIEIIREKYQLYKTVEIMCHPAYIDKFLKIVHLLSCQKLKN